MDARHALGGDGEDLAAAHLQAAGLTLLARRWRGAAEDVRGEIDLVALDGATLVLVEVKTRTSRSSGGALSAVGWDKRRRLRRLAGLYLAEHPHDGPVRGDVVTVEGRPDGTWRLSHLRGAW